MKRCSPRLFPALMLGFLAVLTGSDVSAESSVPLESTLVFWNPELFSTPEAPAPAEPAETTETTEPAAIIAWTPEPEATPAVAVTDESTLEVWDPTLFPTPEAPAAAEPAEIEAKAEPTPSPVPLEVSTEQNQDSSSSEKSCQASARTIANSLVASAVAGFRAPNQIMYIMVNSGGSYDPVPLTVESCTRLTIQSCINPFAAVSSAAIVTQTSCSTGCEYGAAERCPILVLRASKGTFWEDEEIKALLK